MHRAFSAVVCTSCESDLVLAVVTALRPVVGRCSHGVLVRTNCLLGHITCAFRPSQGGVMVVLQPCCPDRTPTGPAFWLGPVRNSDDVALLSDYIAGGAWEIDELPKRLRGGRDWLVHAGRTN